MMYYTFNIFNYNFLFFCFFCFVPVFWNDDKTPDRDSATPTKIHNEHAVFGTLIPKILHSPTPHQRRPKQPFPIPIPFPFPSGAVPPNPGPYGSPLLAEIRRRLHASCFWREGLCALRPWLPDRRPQPTMAN